MQAQEVHVHIQQEGKKKREGTKERKKNSNKFFAVAI